GAGLRRRMKRWLLGALLLSPGPLLAAEIVFYRCTDASGALTVQNMPCPKGMQQSKKVMQAVDTPPPQPPTPVSALPQLMAAPDTVAPPPANATPSPIAAAVPAKEPV